MRFLNTLLAILITTCPGRTADFYSSKQITQDSARLLAKGSSFASDSLARYKGHYTLLAVRHNTGSAEVHQHEADYFVVEKGSAILVTGGTLVNPHSDKPNEVRGTSLAGGERHPVAAGDVVHIAAGEPHQLLIDKGNPFTYFVIKVMDQ